MTTSKKKRLSMLDSLAAAGAGGASPGSMMSTNRALRSARDAVDSHHVWELDPHTIRDLRVKDRLEPEDVEDLKASIEQTGQTVPILVRRHPTEADQYLLVYGRRRLEAIKLSEKVTKVRALVANLDEDSAVRAQISENMARRDLSYIEKALFAQELVAQGFGNQSQVAEVLTVTKSAISMALAIVEMVGPDLIRAIGPAHGVGRPRWEALGKALEATGVDPDSLIAVVEKAYTAADLALVEGSDQDPADVSVQAFEAVMSALPQPKTASPAPSKAKSAPARALHLGDAQGGTLKRGPKGVTMTLNDSAFANWFEANAQEVLNDLHARWQRAED
ncbi:plasmid partitioning protein RepB [Pseudoprimorskyibacter insulae]|uniref:Chromosome-partitioning protein ParB n=1 Tax=Pseudoprimorskyibacter insulae TaxID=1695997 RepID=A0A2R8AZK1_9RHOB|nr:plasmid partitioning protein RepB [Pseudoprimorskyibacter insulae]SPF81472.1 Chromosome-partitioning protein ParB [Pseudoprimorskyibacter insulae]